MNIKSIDHILNVLHTHTHNHPCKPTGGSNGWTCTLVMERRPRLVILKFIKVNMHSIMQSFCIICILEKEKLL